MADTAIEWTDTVWNPTTGCDRVSPGCTNCYALTMAKRLKGMGQAKYQNDGDPRTSGPGFGVSVHPDTLDEPLHWRKPRRVFVNSMSDLFHDAVPDEHIVAVFARMWWSPQHTFQVLTKRHGRMRSLVPRIEERLRKMERDLELVYAPTPLQWPLPNLWLGVSVEDQKRADLRIPPLLETPAAVRFLSCEPLLGPVDLTALRPHVCGRGPDGVCERWIHGIDWVIVGGESGPKARPMHPQWARDLRDQCAAAADVRFFFKQHGEWAPLHTSLHYVTDDDRCQVLHISGRLCGRPWSGWRRQRGHEQSEVVRRYGKKAAGRELDGRTWDEFPEVQPC